MVPRALIGLALLICLTGAAQPPSDQLREPAYRTFFVELQRAVRTNNRERVLRLISYPLRVNFRTAGSDSRRSRFYRTPAAVRASYARIFTPQVRAAILRQRYERVFVNSDGFMIGDGEIWFDRVCIDRACERMTSQRIYSINP